MEGTQAGVSVAHPAQPHVIRSHADDIHLRPQLLLELHLDLLEDFADRDGAAEQKRNLLPVL